MKNLIVILCSVTMLYFQRAEAQCIADIYYLLDAPEPCTFVGSVNIESDQCVDFFNPTWQYVWKIRNAENDDLLAIYQGWAFSHVFERFGGYTFCLEITKDPFHSDKPDITECITYTTCEPCGETRIEYEYLECPVGEGCNVEFTARFDALNTVGVKPFAKYILTYNPTTPEVNAGAVANDIVYPDITVDFYPSSAELNISEDLHSQFQRGCYDISVLLELEEGAGAHSILGGAPCTEILLTSDKVFRCIACDDPDNGCEASVSASAQSNEFGTCDIFACPWRSTEPEDTGTETAEPGPVASPNPTSGRVRVNIAGFDSDQLDLSILDMTGRMIRTEKVKGIEKELDLSTLSQGMYLLVFHDQGKRIHTERLLVQP